jgi:hypothetical protein
VIQIAIDSAIPSTISFSIADMLCFQIRHTIPLFNMDARRSGKTNLIAKTGWKFRGDIFYERWSSFASYRFKLPEPGRDGPEWKSELDSVID